MSVSYPENTIWYVEASSADGKDRTSGSAVAIALQQIGKPATRRKYLLTCAHVVRGTAPASATSDKEPGCGPLLPRIEVWGPDTGYSPDAKIKATLATELKSLADGAVPIDQRANAADDWVALRLENPQASLAMDSVGECAAAEAGELTVFGYPGGSKSFVQSKVVPSPSGDLRFRDHYHGVVRLNGTETRSGMSGGGVFDEQHRLVGIHRSRMDDTLQCHSVSIATILEQLRQFGHEFVATPKPRPARVTRRAVGIGICAVAVTLAGWAVWPHPAICQVFDVDSGDPILVPYTLNHGEEHQTTTGAAETVLKPSFVALRNKVDEWTVTCDGFDETPAKIERPGGELHLYLKRRAEAPGDAQSYVRVISKDMFSEASEALRISSGEIESKSRYRVPHVEDDLQLWVHNGTPNYLDVVLVPYRANQQAAAPIIPLLLIGPGQYSKALEGIFTDKDGVFMAGASHFGRTATPIDWDMLYQTPFVVLDVSLKDNKPTGVFKYYHELPPMIASATSQENP